MSISFIDLRYPELPSSQVEGKKANKKPRLMISVSLDLSALNDGGDKTVSFTLAPGSVASDLRHIANTTVEQYGHEVDGLQLQWRDGTVWKPFNTLEVMNLDRLQVKWMLKTSPNAWQEWPRIRNIHNVSSALKEHWQNRGVEERPNCEVSAWHSFLSSYASVPSEATSQNGEFMALTSQETESVSVEGGMPLPRSLASSSGRRKAAVLLAATKGKQLKLRFLPTQPSSFGRTQGTEVTVGSQEDRVKAPDANALRDPYGEYSGRPMENTVKLPQIN